ncbi:1784_t:CDS:2 [Diversispora eburnea]|uniref:1784_t:CDS:1 n=1 Tax=Diversispora eburnea TaxID=1213867 RepID=A0A9N8V001_9GLOM|nr:1784_t:CDS:2 [Diversispora eburnea]
MTRSNGRNTLPGTPLSYDLFELDEYLPSQFGSSYGILDESIELDWDNSSPPSSLPMTPSQSLPLLLFDDDDLLEKQLLLEEERRILSIQKRQLDNAIHQLQPIGTPVRRNNNSLLIWNDDDTTNLHHIPSNKLNQQHLRMTMV